MKKSIIISVICGITLAFILISRDLAYDLGYIQEVEHGNRPYVTTSYEVIPKTSVKEDKVEILSADGVRRIYPDGTIQTSCVVVYKSGEKTDTVRFTRKY